MADKIKLRRDTLANWEAVNPILDEGEPGFISDTNELVVGDGVTGFSDLKRFFTYQNFVGFSWYFTAPSTQLLNVSRI